MGNDGNQEETELREEEPNSLMGRKETMWTSLGVQDWGRISGNFPWVL